ncbi:MAG: hypothetical protein FWG81_07195 [Betaproteobacteria bacterium]|nr:hypothetical protein [Betaproteobacteria bacterium]
MRNVAVVDDGVSDVEIVAERLHELCSKESGILLSFDVGRWYTIPVVTGHRKAREITAENDHSSTIAFDTLKSIFGKSLDSPEISEFFRKFGEPPEITGPYPILNDEHVYYSWKKYGISVMFRFDKLETIFLYAENVEGFSQYKGEIPYSLKFSETRQSIEQRFGIPTISGGNDVIQFWVSYPERVCNLNCVIR